MYFGTVFILEKGQKFIYVILERGFIFFEIHDVQTSAQTLRPLILSH